INLRGVIIPVIDLRKRFGIEQTGMTEDNRIIIVNFNNKEVGIIVDVASDVTDIPKEIIEAPPEVIGSINVDYVEGVVKLEQRLIVLLNLESLLAPEEVLSAAQVKRGN